VTRIESPQTKLKDMSTEQPQMDYTAYQKLLQRKAELAAELKALEAVHARENSETIAGLAEVMALSKVQKNSDGDFLVVTKEYLNVMRKKIASLGRKSVSTNELQNFQQLSEMQFKMTSAKKEQELTQRLSEELGEKFRKFMRNNFSTLKKAEQEVLKKMFEAKERANLKAKVQDSQSFAEEEEEYEEEEASKTLPDADLRKTSQDESEYEQKPISVGESEDHIHFEEEKKEEPIDDDYIRGDDHWSSMEKNPESVQDIEVEDLEPQRQEHKFSDIAHPAGMLESQVEAPPTTRKKIDFGEYDEDNDLLKGSPVWGSVANIDNDDDIDSAVVARDKDGLWESALEGDQVCQLPTSMFVEPETRKRMATVPPLKTVLAESVMEEDSAKSDFLKGMRQQSSSDMFANDRESIVKRLPIPKLDTGSEVEIKVTDEGESAKSQVKTMGESS
jgi:hypothetical protein